MDWADEKAREWIQAQAAARVGDIGPHLAALLREVKVGEYPCVDCGCLTILKPDQYKWDILAEVRRVVDQSYSDLEITFEQAAKLLSRLEALK